jgi:hypothetical protein
LDRAVAATQVCALACEVARTLAAPPEGAGAQDALLKTELFGQGACAALTSAIRRRARTL